MNYEAIFRERGAAYHEAMRRCPDARRDEFETVVRIAAPETYANVVDAPAGGGYLARYLPATCRWHGHEPCAAFRDDGTVADSSLLPLPWRDGFADVAISVAGVHHFADKRGFFAEVRRVLAPSGAFVLADVHAQSNVARFLDGFVGRHNSTGHEGVYLNDATVAALDAHGFDVRRAQREQYCWWFADRRQMGAFCRSLFDVTDVDEDAVAEAIERDLGTTTRGREVGMNWELLVVACARRD